MTSPVRMYRIREGKMAEWLDGWSRGILPLRRKFGFDVDGAWVLPGNNTFVWISRHDGPDGFEARDAAYYASEERKAVRPDPAPLIENVQSHLVSPVLETLV